MNSILYEKEITLNAIDSAYEKGKKEGTIEELENIKNGTRLIREEYSKLITLCSDFITKKDGK